MDRQHYVPMKGWATEAAVVTALVENFLDEAMIRGLAARVAMVHNPLGGLACCEPLKQNSAFSYVYLNPEEILGRSNTEAAEGLSLNGHKLEVRYLGSSIRGRGIRPHLLAAALHEVGHLLTAEDVLTYESSHPRGAIANTLINEWVADRAGLELIRNALTVDNPNAVGFPYLDLLFTITCRDLLDNTLEGEDLLTAVCLVMSRGNVEHPLLKEIPEDVLREGYALLGAIPQFSIEKYTADWIRWSEKVAEIRLEDKTGIRKHIAQNIIEADGEIRKDIQDREQGLDERDKARRETFERNLKQEAIQESTVRHIPVTSEDWVARTQLARALRLLGTPDIRRKKGWELAPPGRLSGNRMVQKAAVKSIDRFGGDSIETFKRVDKRLDPFVPLTCGIILDQSGSMQSVSEEMSRFGWALSQAVLDVDGLVEVVGMGDYGYPVLSRDTLLSESVPQHSCLGDIENTIHAITLLETRLPQINKTGVRVVILASDMAIVDRTMEGFLAGWISRFRKGGGYVLVYGPAHETVIDMFGYPVDYAARTVPELTEKLLDIYAKERG